MGTDQSAIDSPSAESRSLRLLGHVPDALHGEGLHGYRHNPRQAFLEKARETLQLDRLTG